jgi:hypothetical protein
MRNLLIAEICKYRPQMPQEIIKLKTQSIEVLKRKAMNAKNNYYSLDEGDVLCLRLNVIDK